jgi:hypothetical protein
VKGWPPLVQATSACAAPFRCQPSPLRASRGSETGTASLRARPATVEMLRMLGHVLLTISPSQLASAGADRGSSLHGIGELLADERSHDRHHAGHGRARSHIAVAPPRDSLSATLVKVR